MSRIFKNPTKLRLGDSVVVTSGAHKGETGRIVRFTKDRTRVFVEGVNKVRRHQKPIPALNRPGGIVERESMIDLSNVMPIDPDSKKRTRVGAKILEDGTRARIARRSALKASRSRRA